MKKSGLIFFVNCLILLCSATAWGGEMQCFMCHQEKSQGKSVHPAVNMGCKVCHIGVDASDIPHKILGASKGLPSEGAVLCYSCHDKKGFRGERNVHTPVATGMCASCHEPHSSKSKSLLISGDVCFGCHAREGFGSKKSVHLPVAAGACMNCHNPHQSVNGKLLLSRAPDLCYSCHAKGAFSGVSVHLPVVLGMCESCHEPHQSDYGKLTKLGTRDRCFSCHDREMVSQKAVHRTAGEVACTSCHDPHAGGGKFPLSK
jgi:predicted CXXCH cytochrome family protein